MKHKKNIWNNVFLLHFGQPIGPCKPMVTSYLFPSQNKREKKNQATNYSLGSIADNWHTHTVAEISEAALNEKLWNENCL